MSIEIKDSPNYAALVIEVPEPRKLANSDRLYGIGVAGIEVVVDNSWLERVGEKAVLFPAESQLSRPLTAFANLYRHSELNDDTDQKGYLEDNRRVRALKLRGNVSKGLILPLSKISEITNSFSEDFEVGASFDTVNGIEVSRKFVLPTKGGQMTHAQQKLAKAFKRVDEKVFPMHIETEQYLRNEGHVDDSDVVVVTQKLHGTSVRFGNVPVKIQHKWYERLAAKLGVRLPQYEFALIGGSRKVIKDPGSKTQDHYYSSDIWSKAAQEWGTTIPKGYIVYGELVGWTPDGAPIQRGFTYSDDPRDGYGLYVYRVAMVNEDGVLNDLSWDQVKRFVRSHGLEYTPELWRGPKAALYLDSFSEKNFYEEYMKYASDPEWTPIYNERPVHLSAGGTGLDEGIVLRVDKGGEVPYLLKYKFDSFYLFETDQLDKEEESIEA